MCICCVLWSFAPLGVHLSCTIRAWLDISSLRDWGRPSVDEVHSLRGLSLHMTLPMLGTVHSPINPPQSFIRIGGGWVAGLPPVSFKSTLQGVIFIYLFIYVFESKVHNGVNQVVMTAKNFSVSREDNWCTVGCIMRVRRLHHCRSVFFPVIGCKPGDVIENTRIQSAITVEHSPFLPIRLVKRRPCRRAAPCRQPGVRCSSSTYRTCRRQACPRENTWRWWRRSGCARAA